MQLAPLALMIPRDHRPAADRGRTVRAPDAASDGWIAALHVEAARRWLAHDPVPGGELAVTMTLIGEHCASLGLDPIGSAQLGALAMGCDLGRIDGAACRGMLDRVEAFLQTQRI
jgi:hypothetical protein